jgi:NTE family protein
VKSRLPVHIARKMGAQRILAVDVLLQSIEILEDEVFHLHCRNADLLIKPDAGYIGSFRFDRAREAIELGRNEALAKSSEIRRIMEIGVEIT